MTKEAKEILAQIQRLNPFWSRQFRMFLAEVVGNGGHEPSDEEILAWLRENETLQYGVLWLLTGIPDSWKEK